MIEVNEAINEVSSKNKTYCKICGEKFWKITPSHVKKHGITLREYELRYGKESIVSCNNIFASIKNTDIDNYCFERNRNYMGKSARNNTRTYGLLSNIF